MDPGDHLAMALCWEADEQTMCPEEARRYVYAASQDPVRLAACFQLEDTGTGGELELKRNTRRFHPWDCTRLRKRSKYPVSCVVNGNRYLQMISLQNRDETILLCDLSETGCFYNNGAVVEIGFPFLATRFRDNRFLEKKIKIVESAGPRAVLEESSFMGSGFGSFQQTVRYEIYSEIPAVYISINRMAAPGFSEEIQTVLGMRDYDGFEEVFGGFVLNDSNGILPQVFICPRGNYGDVDWNPGYGLFFTQTLRSSYSMDIMVFLKRGDFHDIKHGNIKELADLPFLTVENQEEITVENTFSMHRPIIVKICHSANEPKWIEENGLWQHRGLSFSQEEPGNAWVRLYLKPGEKGRIRFFGYLEGIIKPGRGCQNIVAFENVRKTGKSFSMKVHVDAENPMLQAVVLETKNKICSVAVNGESYCFFWENQIFLPQGNYQAEVEIESGEPDTPHLCMAYGRIIRCKFNKSKNCLYLTVKNQAWCFDGKEVGSYGVIDLNGRKITDMENAEIVTEACGKSLVRWKAENIVIQFNKMQDEQEGEKDETNY